MPRRAIKLEDDDVGEFRQGEWVHTIEPIILPWFGPLKQVLDSPRVIHSNCHRCEGRIWLNRYQRPYLLETNIIRPAETIHGRVYPARNVVVQLGPGDAAVLRRGPLPRPRQIVL